MNCITSLLIYDNTLSVVDIDELEFLRKVPLRPDNERRRYFVTTSLIGWEQAYSLQPGWFIVVTGRLNMDITRYMYGMFSLLNHISLKYVTRSPTANKPELDPAVTWRWKGDKQLPEPKITQFIGAYTGIIKPLNTKILEGIIRPAFRKWTKVNPHFILIMISLLRFLIWYKAAT